MTSEQNV